MVRAGVRFLHPVAAAFLLAFALCGCSASRMLSTAPCVNGEWGLWDERQNWARSGSETDFMIYDRELGSPEGYCFRLITYIDEFPKDGKWHDYEGRIVYRIPEASGKGIRPGTADPRASVREMSRMFVEKTLASPYLPTSGRTVSRPTFIKVKKNGRELCYNIMFDDVGFGMDYEINRETSATFDITMNFLLSIALTVVMSLL